jgi:predicted nucleotidyltransferase
MDKKIVEIAKQYAEKVRDVLTVDMVVLYGSHVQGTAGRFSDIDIAVIVDTLQYDYLKVSTELFSLVRNIDRRIEPVLLCKSRDKGGFIESVLKGGKIIYKSRK